MVDYIHAVFVDIVITAVFINTFVDLFDFAVGTGDVEI